jgi:hypothetical protein
MLLLPLINVQACASAATCAAAYYQRPLGAVSSLMTQDLARHMICVRSGSWQLEKGLQGYVFGVQVVLASAHAYANMKLAATASLE